MRTFGPARSALVFAIASIAISAFAQSPPLPPPPRHPTGETIVDIYLTPSHVSFEIDYDQDYHPGSGTVMRAMGVYLITYNDGTQEMETRNISGGVCWDSSNENVYPILAGDEYGNLDETGLLITWQYNDGYTGTTTITITHPNLEPATATITAYDGRKGM